jgi:hypothetical protein
MNPLAPHPSLMAAAEATMMDETQGSPQMRWMSVGVAFWHSRRWPADFHNADYEKWDRQNPAGNFTLDWWRNHQLPDLQRWVARPSSNDRQHHA